MHFAPHDTSSWNNNKKSFFLKQKSYIIQRKQALQSQLYERQQKYNTVN